MFKVMGRVIDGKKGTGLPNLMISAAIDGDNDSQFQIGSDITDASGAFSISIKTPIFPNLTPVSLTITVSTPERFDKPSQVLVTAIKKTSAKSEIEKFLIEIGSKELEENEVPEPKSALPSDLIIEAIKSRAEEAAAVDTAWAEVGRERVARSRARKVEFETTFRKRLLEDISTFPKDIPHPQFLSIDGDVNRSVHKLNEDSLTSGSERISSRSTNANGGQRRTRYFLTPQQRQKLDSLLNESVDQSITSQQLETVLRTGEDIDSAPKPTSLSAEDEIFEKFLERTFDEHCAAVHLGEAINDSDNNQESDDDEQDSETQSTNDLVSSVIADIDSPIGQLTQRPGQKDVIGSIRNFALAPGPADSPAFFDFHKLNIAFDDVWKEFLDERIEPFAQQAYMSIVDLGGDSSVLANANLNAVEALNAESRLISSAGVQATPKSLYSQELRVRNDLPGTGGGGILVDEFPPVTEPPIPPLPPSSLPDDDGILDDLGVSTKPVSEQLTEQNPRSLIDKLRGILRGRYAFTAFAADNKHNAINFGVTVTYRQRWEPVSYQVGELARTITLAPGESKKYSKKTKLTRKRAEKEIEKNSSIRRDEFNTSTRSESEIIRKAQSKTNFSISAEGTYNFGIASGDSTTTTDHDAQNASDEAKKTFREAVQKASQEYRQERTLEVSSEDQLELEETETGEISNPNTELTVTYLFFELQRRFRINERIHAAQPVILVAQDLPRPNEIDEAFLIRHGWILKRSLLDDMYEPTLQYVSGSMAGDKVARSALYTAMENHRRIVDQLKDDLYAYKEQASLGYQALLDAVQDRIAIESEEETDGFFADLRDTFLGEGQDPDAARMREEAARNHEQRAVEQVKQVTMALQREVSAYTEATEKYIKAHQTFKEWELRIIDLLLHIKENILHYMQAIWAYEHPDQRYLRLQMKSAPEFIENNGGAKYRFLSDLDLTRETINRDGTVVTRKAVELEYQPNFTVNANARSIAEIADLDSLMGFKGNYMIFPLKENNPLTDYMLEPYIDAGFRLIDPDEKGNINREDFARYVCYLRDTLSDAEFENLKPELLARFKKLILQGPNHGDEIIAPTGSAYIEALPGANPLLEDYKLAHRALDVLDAQEEVRQGSIENIRRAARILGGDLDDPEIDAKYTIEGGGTVHIGTPAVDGELPIDG